MEGYTMCNNYLEIIAGTNNTLNRVYREAAENTESNSMKGLGYLKNFITSIENIANKDACKDARISNSKGNIENFEGYENIKITMNFINKNLGGIEIMTHIKSLYDALHKYKELYMEGYEKKTRLVVLEYESCVYMVVTGLAMIMSTNMEVVQNGTQIKIQKKNGSTYGIIPKTIVDLDKQLKDSKHKQYLEEIIKSKEISKQAGAVKDNEENVNESTTYFESVVSDTIEAIDSIFRNVGKIGHYTKRLVNGIKSSVFGIVPLIRSILYLRYKKKADTILYLDQTVQDIQNNIEQLQNIKNMDQAQKAEIIKKQKALCEQYRKKAEKLRAELTEGEKDAAIATKQENPQMKNTDDDFVLEGVKVTDFFESASRSLSEILKRRTTNVLNYKPTLARGKGPRGKYGEMKRRSNVWKTVPIPNDVNKEKAINAVYNDFFKQTAKDSISLTIGNNVFADNLRERTISKIGGTPYWPKDKKYPTTNGKPMVMAAQLNFSELPHVEGFPSKGILQFFLNDYEWDDNTVVVYHPTYSTKEEDMLKEIPRTSFDEDHEDYPFKGMFKIIKSTIKKQAMTINCDNDFDEIIVPIIKKHLHVDVKCMWDLPDDVRKPLLKLLSENSWGHRIGGYPDFTQYDPRKKGQYDTLLFQLDSDKGIMWGDVGIANWFISAADLKKKDFSKVFFTWDCY